MPMAAEGMSEIEELKKRKEIHKQIEWYVWKKQDRYPSMSNEVRGLQMRMCNGKQPLKMIENMRSN